MNTTMLHETCPGSTRRDSRWSRSKINVLPYNAPHQLVHVHYFFISLVLSPLNSLVWWEVPLGYKALNSLG